MISEKLQNLQLYLIFMLRMRKLKKVNFEMYNCRVLKHIDCLSGRLPTETWLWRGHYNNNTIPHSLSAKAER